MMFRPLLASAAILALAACGSPAEDPDPAQEVAASERATAIPDPVPATAGTPQEFVAMAASSDMYELEAARLARQNGSAAALRAFADMMITDHTASSAELKTAAEAMQPAIAVPTAMLPVHQAQLDELREAGDNFDEVYARQQVAAHERALSMMRGYSGATADDALAAFAAKTAPIIEGHLQTARALPEG
jgi:putative membrane protein